MTAIYSREALEYMIELLERIVDNHPDNEAFYVGYLTMYRSALENLDEDSSNSNGSKPD